MCGITGFVRPSASEEALREHLGRMTGAIAHRGPDSDGHWVDAESGVALGHRRLAIVDLTPTGAQPMASGSGRYMIVFNGEIYNFGALRDELAALGHRFAGSSDTEVMLAAFESWGLEPAVRRFVGMFAFAVWDRQDRVLTLGRDRLGEKPLYYGWAGEALLFGSELKALRAHPAWAAPIDRGALSLLMRHNYIPAPHTIHTGIFKLPPGTLLTFEPEALARRLTPTPVTYWSLVAVAEAGLADPLELSDAEAIETFESLLGDAVKAEMVADVPLGAFLSGGIDSSLIVALMQSCSARPVKTFTIGFHEAAYNEAEHAKAVARHLGTEHTELYVTPQEARDVIPRLPSLYDEPFSDSSQIPTFLVSQLARRHVTVSLSGDAGDELFGGYTRYETAEALWRKLSRLPGPARALLAGGLRALPVGFANQALAFAGPALARHGRPGPVGDKLRKAAELLGTGDEHALYRRLVSHWKDPQALTGAAEPATVLTDPTRWVRGGGFADWMMAADATSYLPDDILVKVDRAAMGVSLESRVPLLDHRVVEFAWRLPQRFKVRDGRRKWLLRETLDRHVPRALIERPKQGFGVPVGEWLRGPLREWAEELLREDRLRHEGFFDPGPIRARWDEHLSGRQNWQYLLWDVLMFQAWLEQSSRPVTPATRISP